MKNSLGRSPGNSIRFADDFVSSNHSSLVYKFDNWWIEDLGSTNGTLVNGRPVSKLTKIVAGDVIQIGITKLKLGKK